MKNFVRLEPVPDDVTELFPIIIQYMDYLKTSAYKNLVNGSRLTIGEIFGQ